MNAASVLPEPVGAMTSVSSPLPMARQAPAWACVGSANAPSNQARVAGENASSASAVPVSGDSSAMLPYCPAPLTFSAVGRSALFDVGREINGQQRAHQYAADRRRQVDHRRGGGRTW